MSAPGTPKASQAAITAVQEALDAHRISGGGIFHVRGRCGEEIGVNGWQTHRAQAAADAAAPHNAAQALREAGLRWDDDASPLARVSSRYVRNTLLRAADRIEAG